MDQNSPHYLNKAFIMFRSNNISRLLNIARILSSDLCLVFRDHQEVKYWLQYFYIFVPKTKQQWYRTLFLLSFLNYYFYIDSQNICPKTFLLTFRCFCDLNHSYVRLNSLQISFFFQYLILRRAEMYDKPNITCFNWLQISLNS